jgi:hypothetical protein
MCQDALAINLFRFQEFSFHTLENDEELVGILLR